MSLNNVYFKSKNHQHKIEEKQKKTRWFEEEVNNISQEEVQKLKEKAAEKIVREGWQKEHDEYLRHKEEKGGKQKRS